MLGIILKYPRLIGAGLLLTAVIGFGIHYRLVIGERNDLRITKIELEGELAKAARNAALLKEDLRLATVATAEVAAERDSQITARNTLRAGRQIDVEARMWGEQALPIGEITRLCEALPEMAGCQNTIPSN